MGGFKMKTSENNKNENTRINSIIRRFVLVTLSVVAALNILMAGDPEFAEYAGVPVDVKLNLFEYKLQLALEEEPEPEMEIEDWMIDLSYWNVLIKENPVVVESDDNSKPDSEITSLSDNNISIALQEEPEPEMEIEDWMLDIDEFIQQINFAKK